MVRSSLQNFLGKAQAELENLFPATVMFSGDNTQYAASAGGYRRGDQTLSIEGLLSEQQVGFRVRKALLSAMPEVGTRLTWVDRGNLTFRILRVSDGSVNDPAWHLACEAINK
jgi:hypothetical protein